MIKYYCDNCKQECTKRYVTARLSSSPAANINLDDGISDKQIMLCSIDCLNLKELLKNDRYKRLTIVKC